MYITRCITRFPVAMLLLTALAAPSAAQIDPECEVVDFDQFAHGDSVTSLNVLGTPLTLSATRNSPAGVVDPTAYDTELWDDAGNPPPNNTHDDTQQAILCNDAANGGLGTCDGRILMIPDVDFANDGDDTQGGFVTLSGFDGMFEIPSYAAVDSDNTDRDIILRVGAGLTQVGTSTGQGNGTVETVETDPHVFTDSVEFEYEGSGGIDDIEICRFREILCGDGILDAGEECDDGNLDDGDGCSSECTLERAGEGCTPGYWKQRHHRVDWVDFAPEDIYAATFGVSPSFEAETLLEVLQQGGGGEKALGRHAVAAILNAASSEVDYFESVAEIISRVQEAYATGDFEGVKNLLDEQNNEGCPL